MITAICLVGVMLGAIIMLAFKLLTSSNCVVKSHQKTDVKSDMVVRTDAIGLYQTWRKMRLDRVQAQLREEAEGRGYDVLGEKVVYNATKRRYTVVLKCRRHPKSHMIVRLVARAR